MSSTEDPGIGCSQDSEAGSAKQLTRSEPSKENSEPSSTTEENSDMTLPASSNTSGGCDSNQDLDNTEKKSIDISHVSGKTKREWPKTKIVSSRYKAAAAATSNRNMQGNSSSNSSSSYSKSSSNETINSGTPSLCMRLPQRNKPIRARPEDLSRSRLVMPPGQSTKRAASWQPRPQRSGATNVTNLKLSRFGASKTSKAAEVGSKSILHSTALNTTLMTDAANVRNSNNMLSSTFVGGFKHNTTVAALMELPDISVIKPEGNTSGNKTVLSSVGEEPHQIDCDGTSLPEITSEMLEEEYMKYLQWAYVDVDSEQAFAAQLKEMQNQIVFLEELVNEKQEEVSELKQKTELLVHHQRVGKAFDMQTKLLQALIDDLPACEEAEKAMERELEMKLHQVKMENMYIPQDHIKYRDEMTDALNTQISLLQELEDVMGPQTQQRNSTIKLLTDLWDVSELAERCGKETQQAAGLTVEDASHQLGAKQINLGTESDK